METFEKSKRLAGRSPWECLPTPGRSPASPVLVCKQSPALGTEGPSGMGKQEEPSLVQPSECLPASCCRQTAQSPAASLYLQVVIEGNPGKSIT